jgi:hypothetical protein
MERYEEVNPTRFGLTSDRVEYFRSAVKTSGFLPFIFGWLSFFAMFVLAKPIVAWVFSDQWRWPILCLFYLPGLIVVYLLSRLRVYAAQHRKRNQPDFAAFRAYQEAYEQALKLRYEAERAQETERIQRRAIAQRKHREEERWWKSLDGPGFERELARLFQTMGFQTIRKGGSGAGGVDLEIASGGRRIIVQCKAQHKFVSPSAVRDLYGTLLHQKADEAWLVTTSGFFSGTKSFAYNKPIRLITINQILKGEWPPATISPVGSKIR